MAPSTPTSSARPPCEAIDGLITCVRTWDTRSATSPVSSRSWGTALPTAGLGLGTLGLVIVHPWSSRLRDRSSVAPRMLSIELAATTSVTPSSSWTWSPGEMLSLESRYRS